MSPESSTPPLPMPLEIEFGFVVLVNFTLVCRLDTNISESNSQVNIVLYLNHIGWQKYKEIRRNSKIKELRALN